MLLRNVTFELVPLDIAYKNMDLSNKISNMGTTILLDGLMIIATCTLMKMPGNKCKAENWERIFKDVLIGWD